LAPLVIAMLAATAAACGDPCSNRVLNQVASPSAEHVAVVYVRECGATTGPSTNVSIVKDANASITGAGNVLVLKDPPAMVEAKGHTRVSWIAEDTLKIDYLFGRAVQNSARTSDGVVVQFLTHGGPEASDTE